ncbi:MAG: ArsR/SmtB family transcription factor [Actinomycetota bacterium]
MTDPQPLFTALADPTRRAVFERLSAEGPASASRLAEEMPVSRQAIAKHLAALDEAGLVERTARGREVRYEARPQALQEMTGWVEKVGRDWETRLQRLKKMMDEA